MNLFFRNLLKFFKNRLVILFISVILMFSLLAIKLFNLQILNGDYYNRQVKATTLQEIVVSAPRGNIYDRYGLPLAINKSSFTVNIDASVSVENQNEILMNLINMLERNGENIIDDFPMSKTEPFIFIFDGSGSQEKRWKQDMNLDEDITAQEAFEELREKFEIDKNWSNADARKVLSLRCQLYLKRYLKYIPVTVAYDIKTETISAIEEEKSSYPGIYIDVEALRNYPSGKYFSHLLGYIRGITQSELANYQEQGYSMNDLIGKDGIEKAFELQLKGEKGKKYVEVDSVGRHVSTLTSRTVEPIPGNKVFLTVDRNLQEAAYNIFENNLKETIISRLTGRSRDYSYSLKQLLMSMTDTDNIQLKGIMTSKTGTVQNDIKKYILSVDNTAAGDADLARQILIDGIDRGAVSPVQLILVMYEQNTITCDEAYLARIKNGNISSLQVIIDKMNQGEITPGMTGMDPCTGSVVVQDIHTGDVLVSVSYPSYDNNRFVNNFDNEYYTRLNTDTITTPLVNRPFTEMRAPGSTFKMITATAALEEGIVTPSTTIYDHGTFTKANKPYARCWIGSGKGSHKSVNVSHALEVSCNYFFYEVSFNMGNSKSGTTEKGIKTLNKYMEAYGLNDPTGVEIYEILNSRTNYPSNISSPEYKKYIYTQRDPDSPESELKWYDGDTIRTAIGQSMNNYTSATMTKYVSTLANGGTRYTMHFLNKISSYNGNVLETYTPKVETTIDIKPQNLKAIHEGMYLVTSGSRGTLRGVFRDFPIKVAAKSGTAQQSNYRSEHTTFVAFVPYDDPQIAITVIIPFGNDSTTLPAPNVAKEIIAEYMGLNRQPETEAYNILYK